MILILLTSRDIEFLTDMTKVRYLNSQRIMKLYGNYKSSMRRMKKLEEEKFIKVIDHLYTRENIYAPTKKTFNTLLSPYISITKTDKVNHFLACADFYFSIKDKNVKHLEYEVQYKFKHNGKKNIFRPDLLVEIDKWYFIEIDLCNRKFEEKVETWENFYKSNNFLNYFDKYPLIIIVSTNCEKVKRDIEKVKKINLNYVYRDYNEIKEWNYKYPTLL